MKFMKDITNPLLLAPMEGVTDLPFRLICKKLGADIVFTEFIASEAIVRNIDKSISKMKLHQDEHPIAVQIFGSQIEPMVESAKIAEDAGADFVDINFGCWVKKVVNHDAGAAFMKNPDRMAEMTNAVVNAVSIPVTVKTRLGWSKDNINILETSKKCEDAGAQMITIHCRTRDMGMSGKADWTWISHVKEILNIPVILNGDVLTADDTKLAFDTTNCDGVMIGRAAINNPFIFKQSKELLQLGKIFTDFNAQERINLCLEHLSLSIEFKGLSRGILEFRKYYSGYLKGLYNSSKIRQELVQLESFEEINYTLKNYLEFLQNSTREITFFPVNDELNQNEQLICSKEIE
ncbi:MAG: tRNA dihydrouridine synthase DusB [Candidatus Kapaibacteriota bacterium]